MDKQFITTKDGSTTLFLPSLNETYHSVHGAVQEAEHVYIQKGLAFLNPIKQINILEIGFGTGLNALLTMLYCNKNNINCSYITLEKYPLTNQEIQQVNYGTYCNGKNEFDSIHNAEWNVTSKLSQNFEIQKMQFDLLHDELNEKFDLIYFDAFAPDKQAEMWTLDVFSKIKSWMNPNAILVTYCCKGSVKRSLKELNFNIEKTDGPIGKREMLRVSINN